MRRSLALLTTVVLAGIAAGTVGTARASSPTASSLTAPRSGSVSATWAGSTGPGIDLGGCPSSVSATSDHHSLTLTVPGGLYSTVTTATKVAIHATTGQDLDLLVVDKSGSTVGSSASGGGDEAAVMTDLPGGTYDVIVCTGTATGDAYTATATVTSSPRPAAVVAAPPLMTFTPATVVDPVLFGGEPGFTFDPTSRDGNARSFVDWPVSSRTMIGVLFRSEDGGLSYTKRYSSIRDLAAAGPACITRQVPYCPAGGGGDTDIDINPSTGSVAMAEQESLANQAVGVSLDHGTTFPADHVDPALAKTATGVDRQWQTSWKGTKTRFIAYHVPLVGEYINRSDNDGATGSWSVPVQPQIPGVSQSGSFVADNTGGVHDKTLYIGYIGSSTVPGGLSGFDVAASTDGGKTFQSHPIPGAASPRSFTTLSIDTAGNLYAAYVDSGRQQTFLAVARANAPGNLKAPGSTWSKPVMVSKAPLKVTIFSNTVAGSPGRVAIGYYGTSAPGPTPDDVKPGTGGWYPYVAVSSNALCQSDPTPCAAPTFSQDKIAHKINHDTNICTSGTACAADPNANRNLLDYFSIDVDALGHLGFVWSDTTNATLEPFVKVARQASGPSLYAGRPDARLSQRANGEKDPAGDAKYPIAGGAILTAANQKALDLTGTVLSRAGNGDVVVRVKVPGLAATGAGAVPGGGTMLDDSGTPIQQARYVTRWDLKGQAYYAEATVDGLTGGVSYGSGRVSSAEGVFNGGNVSSTLGNTYQPLTAAAGTIRNGEIDITVPAGAVGSPREGEVLYSVGSYALIGPKDSVGSLQTLPLTVDSTPTFDTAFGTGPFGASSVGGTSPGTRGAGGSSGGSAGGSAGAGAGGGRLAATGEPAGLAALSLLVLGVGLVLLRRTRHA